MFWATNIDFNKPWKAKELQKDWEIADALTIF